MKYVEISVREISLVPHDGVFFQRPFYNHYVFRCKMLKNEVNYLCRVSKRVNQPHAWIVFDTLTFFISYRMKPESTANYFLVNDVSLSHHLATRQFLINFFYLSIYVDQNRFGQHKE